MSELNVQIGGDHYKQTGYQPIELIERFKVPFLEGCIIKRITRYKRNSGKGIQDLEKVIHEFKLIHELRYDKFSLSRYFKDLFRYFNRVSINLYCEINNLNSIERDVINCALNHSNEIDIKRGIIAARLLKEKLMNQASSYA